MSTLGKVAMGIIIAKGVDKVMAGNNNIGGSGISDMLGGLMGGSNNNTSTSGTDLGSLLGGLMGGNNNTQGGSSTGGLSDLMSSLGGAQGGGGLGGLLSSLAGGGTQQSNNNNNTPDFGSLFNDALQGKEPEKVSPDDEKTAELLLRAMISAAKSDGTLDDDEQKKIADHLGEISDEEAALVQQAFQAPLDLDGLVASVPAGLEKQVYLMSLLAIDLDSKEEAVYLDKLRDGLKLSYADSNEIHDQLNAPKLYS